MELVGRSRELKALQHALDRSATGRRTVVAVRGAPGIGKTSLLVELRAEAARRGVTVLTSAVTDVETSIGWAGLATMLRGAEPAIDRLRQPRRDALMTVTGHGNAEPVEPLAVAAALAEHLARQAEAGPLLVIVDDVHWLDAASAGALSFAVRLLSESRILFVLASRPVRIPLDLARLVDPSTPDDLIVIEPAPLSVGGVHELLDQYFGLHLGRIDLVRLHEMTGGNPLHVVETGRLLAEGERLTETLLPASLIDVIDMQMERLDAAHVPVLCAAALMPSIDLELLAQLHPIALVEAAVGEAESLGVVEAAGSTVTFRHPLLRAGLTRLLSSVERRALHRRLAELSTETEVCAFHLSEAAHRFDEAAAHALEAAASAAAARGLLVQAAHHAFRSFELTAPTDVGHRARRRMVAAETALQGGDPRRTLDLLLPLSDGEERSPERLTSLRLIAAATGAVAGAVACVPWIERLVEESPHDSEIHVRAQIMLSRALLYENVPAACLAAEQAVARTGSIGIAEWEDDAFASQSVAHFLAGRPVDFDRLIGIASTRLAASSNTVSRLVGEMLVWSDRLDEAIAVVGDELRAHESSGLATGELDSLSQLVDVHLRAGDLDMAARLADRALTLTRAMGSDRGIILRSADIALVSALRGDTRRPDIERIDAGRSQLATVDVAQLDAVLGHTALLSGDHAAAAARLRATHRLATGIGLADLGALPYHGNLIEALLAIGDVDEADRVATSMARTASLARRGRGDAEATRARALVLASRGDLVAADTAAGEAVAAFAGLPLPIEQGRALLIAGSIARRRKQRARAGELLQAADERFVHAGAVAYSTRVRAELERLGGARTNELTATETQVVELVMAGRRNDEIAAELFITRRTVEANLTRVYRKIGVRSRSELAARLRGG